PSPNYPDGNVVSAMPRTHRDARDRLFDGSEREEYQLDLIASSAPCIDAAEVCMPGERCLEREAASGRGVTVDLLQHHSARAKGDSIGVERRQARGDQISVDEDRNTRLGRQKRFREGRLP